ncbi:transcriptional regulator [Saccharopolyspora sp. HNM0986]|uniref:helix-turn-helix transcriptional regulator n=2 Tax=Saccharopolyspora TaxID=1835 RepID=UPI00190E0499|nr:metalloregulator ArsR/SmtB family transcription factor [Saccharopolyspora sp. HNM0986]MBK0867053.1 transcriptional regulator [Saccharopolyspora sp. HNM0986]
MKNAGTPSQAVAPNSGQSAQGATAPGAAAQSGDGGTRHSVARLLLERGPITAAAVAEALGISAVAVRRHLDALVAEGEAYTRESSARQRRGRGRPAKLYLLTEVGRARFGHAYDDLAVAALRFIAESDGEQAVRSFAEQRIAALVEHHREALAAARTPAERAEVLAGALTREGYAASTRSVASGEQLCQHHCPVAHVAADFPQLCEAETAAFAEVLGTHVQRLATIANGDAACTTHVPLTRNARTTGTGAETDEVAPGPATTDQAPAAGRRPAGEQTAPIPDGGESV